MERQKTKTFINQPCNPSHTSNVQILQKCIITGTVKNCESLNKSVISFCETSVKVTLLKTLCTINLSQKIQQ